MSEIISVIHNLDSDAIFNFHSLIASFNRSLTNGFTIPFIKFQANSTKSLCKDGSFFIFIPSIIEKPKKLSKYCTVSVSVRLERSILEPFKR